MPAKRTSVRFVSLASPIRGLSQNKRSEQRCRHYEAAWPSCRRRAARTGSPGPTSSDRSPLDCFGPKGPPDHSTPACNVYFARALVPRHRGFDWFKEHCSTALWFATKLRGRASPVERRLCANGGHSGEHALRHGSGHARLTHRRRVGCTSAPHLVDATSVFMIHDTGRQCRLFAAVDAHQAVVLGGDPGRRKPLRVPRRQGRARDLATPALGAYGA